MVKIPKTLVLFLLFFLSPVFVEAAALSLSPSTGSFEVGNRVTVKVIATSDTHFNAVSGVLSYPPSIFAVDSVSKAGSVLNFWVTEPVVLKPSGTIKFEGVALGGFLGSTGTVVTINLRAVGEGVGKFSFQSGQILANDGEGTDITGNLVGATFSVTEATVVPKPPKPEVVPPVVEEEVIQPKPTLTAPEIVAGKKYGNQVILGTSNYPNAQVLVTFTAIDGTKVFIIGTSDNNGEFSLLVPASLKRGSYAVSAVMIKKDKTNSETSNIVTITIGSIFSDITREVWFLILLLILAILYLLIRIYLHFRRDKNIHKIIKKEVEEAEDLVHKSFDILREDVSDNNNEKLSITELKRLSELKRDIDSAEKIITKEVDEIK